MQKADLIRYIENPHLLDKQSVKQLQELVIDFPYFQPAHVLLSLASKKWDASVYQQTLKKTAIVVSNRSHLFNLIHKIEKELSETDVKTAVEIIKDKAEQPQNTEETAAHELNILKAAEISVDQPVVLQEIVEHTPAPVAETIQLLEKEIEVQLVAAFVEKEILTIPELYHPKNAGDKPESFGAWLSFLKKNNGQPYSEIEERVKLDKVKKTQKDDANELPKEFQARKQKNKALIDKIIDKNPGLIRTREEQKFFASDTKAKESLLDNEHLVTETLARIYALQGSVNKAVRAYEILSLKFPQKSAYFASLIQKLKNNQ